MTWALYTLNRLRPLAHGFPCPIQSRALAGQVCSACTEPGSHSTALSLAVLAAEPQPYWLLLLVLQGTGGAAGMQQPLLKSLHKARSGTSPGPLARLCAGAEGAAPGNPAPMQRCTGFGSGEQGTFSMSLRQPWMAVALCLKRAMAHCHLSLMEDRLAAWASEAHFCTEATHPGAVLPIPVQRCASGL